MNQAMEKKMTRTDPMDDNLTLYRQQVGLFLFAPLFGAILLRPNSCPDICILLKKLKENIVERFIRFTRRFVFKSLTVQFR